MRLSKMLRESETRVLTGRMVMLARKYSLMTLYLCYLLEYMVTDKGIWLDDLFHDALCEQCVCYIHSVGGIVCA